jgi:hypothetical protein
MNVSSMGLSPAVYSPEAALPALQTNLAMAENQMLMAQNMLRNSLGQDRHLLDMLA